MSLFRSTPKIKVGDKVTLTGTITAIGPPYLGSDDTHALIVLDNPSELQIQIKMDVRLLEDKYA